MDGQRNIAAEEGGQEQMHPDEKPHRPMLKRVRDKMKKMRNTITGHGHGNGDEHEPEHEHDTGGGSSIDMDEDEVEDVEDKSVMDSGLELHGAPMYDSETIPSAAKDVERNGATEMRLGDLGGQAAAKDVERKDATGIRLGDLGGQEAAKGVESNDDPAVRLGDLGGQAETEGVERNDDPAVRLGDLDGQVAAKGVERNDDPAVRLGDLDGQAAPKSVERNDDPGPGVRLGDLGGPVVEDPVAPHSKTPTPRGGEDIGTTDVVRDFQAMTVSDDPKQAGAEKMDRDQVKETEAMPVSDGTGEEWTDAPTDAAYTGSYTDTAAGTTEDVEDKSVMDSGPELHGAPMYDSETIPSAAKDVERNDATGMRLGDLGGEAAAKGVERNDDPAVRLGDLGGQAAAKDVERNDDPGVRLGDLGGPVVEDPVAPHSKTPTPRGGEDIGTTDVVRDFQAMTVSDDQKQAGAEKMDRDQVKETEAMPVSDGTGEEWTDAPTDAAYTGSYTDTAAGTTEDGKNLASTDYEKVAGVGTVVASTAQQVTPGFGAGGNAQDDSGTTEPIAVDAGKRDLDLPKEGTPASYPSTEELKNAATDAKTEGAHVATYTDMFKSAAAGTTEYGMQLASSVYTAVSSRVYTTSPGVGAQDGSAAATVTPGAAGPGNGQDKGVSGVTAHIAEKLSPGEEDQSLSEGITGAVQQRKEGDGSTVAKAHDAVTSLTGGNRVSETVQPTTEGNIGGGVAAEGPTLRGEEIEAPKTNTNVM